VVLYDLNNQSYRISNLQIDNCESYGFLRFVCSCNNAVVITFLAIYGRRGRGIQNLKQTWSACKYMKSSYQIWCS